jgi:hypothetical protein
MEDIIICSNLRCYPGMCLQGLGKNMGKPRVSCILAGIRTGVSQTQHRSNSACTDFLGGIL